MGAIWTRVTYGWCEADVHRRPARWEGPATRSGGTLYCGACKRAKQATMESTKEKP